MTPDQISEAMRLHAAGFKLCELYPNSKRPVGDGWNNKPVNQVHAAAGGYGLMLAANGLCSVDLDDEFLSELGFENVGLTLDDVRHAGVWTNSTRPGSGGRVTFRVPPGVKLEWVKFSSKQFGTVLELRAASPNLQDTLPGTVYNSQDGSGPWRQGYANGKVMEDAPVLSGPLLDWWACMTADVDYKQAQQRLFIGPTAQVSISSSDGKLGYGSQWRTEFNRSHSVADILARHGYTEHRNHRWSPSTATGAPAVREIAGKNDLWQSDHASDPLHGTFDAWTAHVVLDHDYELATAEAAYVRAKAAEAVDGFEDEATTPYTGMSSPNPGQLSLPAPSSGGAAGSDDDGWGELDALVSGVAAAREGGGEVLASGGALGGFTHLEELPAFDRESKSGKVKAEVGNLVLALERPDVASVRLGLDEFRDEVMLAPPGTENWRPFRDADYVWLRQHLQNGMNGFSPITKELIRDVVYAVAERNRFDSARLWLESLPWDGVRRVENFFFAHFSADDSPYTRAASRYQWTAMAGRVLDPGCKADMCVVLVGNQGVGKSSAIAAMVPGPEFFVEVSLSDQDDNLARKLRGKLIGEIAELRGLHTKDAESIKAFMTRTHEEWVQKWKEFSSKYPRRLVMMGTTNQDQFLGDDTGERRWLPLRVGTVDVALIKALSAQLWAEARELWKVGGIAWQDAQRLATEEHAEYKFSDPWEPVVARWVSAPGLDDDTPLSKGYVTSHEVLVGALRMEDRNLKRSDEMKVASILKKLGFSQTRRRVVEGEKPKWIWVQSVPSVPT